MIITSNSVNHEYTIPNLITVGQVDSNYNVIEQVTIYINSSTTFDHTYEKTIYEEPGMVGITSIVTESKTVEEFTHFFVDLETSNILSFEEFDSLEEDTVLQWAFEANPEKVSAHQNANEEKVLEKKDRVLNPLKYYKDSPVTPWRRRADEALASE